MTLFQKMNCPNGQYLTFETYKCIEKQMGFYYFTDSLTWKQETTKLYTDFLWQLLFFSPIRNKNWDENCNGVEKKYAYKK